MLLLLGLTSCATTRRNIPFISQGAIPNPLTAQVSDREFLWNQIVDSLDDHFRIRFEQRVRVFDGVLTEGNLSLIHI